MKSSSRQLFANFVRCVTFGLLFSSFAFADNAQKSVTKALISTNYGDITLELFDQKAPKTVKNFIQYANDKFYDNTIFHRVIPNFMIQGGGFDQEFNKKATRAPIENEAKPFVANSRGTIAMARTSNPHSATSQFFINVVNNQFLNKSNSNAGYAVFGKVIDGMAVADKIAGVKTGAKGHMRDVPSKDVIIKNVTIIESERN